MPERPARSTRPARIHSENASSVETGRFAYEPKEPPVFDYEADLYIDPNFLDAEWLNHANVFMRYSAESARAKKAASFADEKVKTLRSQLVKAANEDPDGTLGKGIKATAPNVEAYYRDHPKYQQAKKDWIEAVYYADLMDSAIYAFQARKSALENLVRLQGQGYNAEPQAPRDLPDAAKYYEEAKRSSIEKRIRDRTNGRG